MHEVLTGDTMKLCGSPKRCESKLLDRCSPSTTPGIHLRDGFPGTGILISIGLMSKKGPLLLLSTTRLPEVPVLNAEG